MLLAAVANGAMNFIALILLLLANRLCDGLDGVGRATVAHRRIWGAYLDIVLDFIFYAGFVFACAVARAAACGWPPAFLIFSFVGTGTQLLAHAIMAAKRGWLAHRAGRQGFRPSGRADGRNRDHCRLRPDADLARQLSGTGLDLRQAVLAHHA